jgi:hypothetical protein
MAEEHATEEIREKAREKAALKGVEGVLARRYPELYRALKEMAVETGQDVLDVFASLANWAFEVRKYSTVITKDDLKNITPESLHAAMKFLLFYQEQYYKTQAYANVAAVQSIYSIVEGLLQARLAQASGREGAVILPPIPSPSTVERISQSILRAIELFTIGKPEITEQLATAVARKLIEMSQSGGGGAAAEAQK